VRHQLTAPYSPQQNDVVELRNQTIVATTHSMMKAKGLPSYFCGEAIATVMYLPNRLPMRSVQGMAPYEAWRGRKLSVAHLRTFDCIVHAKAHGEEVGRSKHHDGVRGL
jgi:hypothetical protein